jgi:hypothetical protein
MISDVVTAALALVATVFGCSAYTKLHSGAAFRAFGAGLAQTGLLPSRGRRLAAGALAGAEAAVAAGAVTAAALGGTADAAEHWVAAGVLVAAVLLTAVLTAGTAIVIQRGRTVRCPCFGTAAGQPLDPTHLVRNLILLTALLAGLAACLWAPAPVLAGPALAAAGRGLVAAVTGIVVAAFLVRWEDLLFLLAGSRAGRYQR